MGNRYKQPNTLAWARLMIGFDRSAAYRRMKLTGVRPIHERVTELAENIRGKAGWLMTRRT
jgi:hypothetical protein